MTDVSAVVAAAQKLGKEKDVRALELSVGLREKADQLGRPLADLSIDPKYDGPTMGPLEDLKAIGRRVVARWNRELHSLICSQEAGGHTAERDAIVQSLNIGEVAVIGAVAAGLMGLGTPAPIAAAAAPLIVKKFVWPAKDELCGGWKDLMDAAKAEDR